MTESPIAEIWVAAAAGTAGQARQAARSMIKRWVLGGAGGFGVIAA